MAQAASQCVGVDIDSIHICNDIYPYLNLSCPSFFTFLFPFSIPLFCFSHITHFFQFVLIDKAWAAHIRWANDSSLSLVALVDAFLSDDFHKNCFDAFKLPLVLVLKRSPHIRFALCRDVLRAIEERAAKRRKWPRTSLFKQHGGTQLQDLGTNQMSHIFCATLAVCRCKVSDKRVGSMFLGWPVCSARKPRCWAAAPSCNTVCPAKIQVRRKQCLHRPQWRNLCFDGVTILNWFITKKKLIASSTPQNGSLVKTVVELVASAYNKRLKASSLWTIPQLVTPYLWSENVRRRFFALAMKRDELMHVSQTKLLVDVRSLVQTPEGMILEAWPRSEAIDSTVCYMTFLTYKSVTTLLANNSLYVEGELWCRCSGTVHVNEGC